MGNVISIGAALPPPRWRQVPVAYGRVAMRGTLPAGQWAFQPQEPFRPNLLLTWLAEGAPGARLTAFQISGVDAFSGPVPARVFESSISIEALLGKYLKCSGAGECVMCSALVNRPPVVEFNAVERVATPPGASFQFDAVEEVGGRCAIEHGELQGIALIGVVARAVEL